MSSEKVRTGLWMCVVLMVCALPRTQLAAKPYPSEVRESFLKGCAEQSSKAHCDCVLARLEAEVPLGKLVDGSLEDATIDGFISDCLAKVETAEWPREMATAFMEECGQSSEEPVCTCVMNTLKAELPARVLMSDGVPEGRLEELVTACGQELSPAEPLPEPSSEGVEGPVVEPESP
ncbi:MAG: hypothetical protein CO108_00405 [Deltaproteobacteria bacterium CG_4_9_14_3_um_filter_63_12]|nr:MAG: hypothetical protein CO108_00405 [Deltaproteobacteria bacterium CG_4_9_14_3_um_filter_63_12]